MAATVTATLARYCSWIQDVPAKVARRARSRSASRSQKKLYFPEESPICQQDDESHLESSNHGAQEAKHGQPQPRQSGGFAHALLPKLPANPEDEDGEEPPPPPYWRRPERLRQTGQPQQAKPDEQAEPADPEEEEKEKAEEEEEQQEGKEEGPQPQLQQNEEVIWEEEGKSHLQQQQQQQPQQQIGERSSLPEQQWPDNSKPSPLEEQDHQLQQLDGQEHRHDQHELPSYLLHQQEEELRYSKQQQQRRRRQQQKAHLHGHSEGDFRQQQHQEQQQPYYQQPPSSSWQQPPQSSWQQPPQSSWQQSPHHQPSSQGSSSWQRPSSQEQSRRQSPQHRQQQQRQHKTPQQRWELRQPRELQVNIAGKMGTVLAFYWSGRAEPCDLLCQVPFLGNFWEVEPLLKLALEGKELEFTNAEAAFQALKFWGQAENFVRMTGEEAFHEKLRLKGQEDFTYAGTGGNWQGMRTVLQAKYRPGTEMANRLLKTGNAFLLEHNTKVGRDETWSNNGNGTGRNWLGMQLMLLRDELRGTFTTSSWTHFIERQVNPSDGKYRPGEGRAWQSAVHAATQALLLELPSQNGRGQFR